MKTESDLFGRDTSDPRTRISVVPTSVLELSEGVSPRRREGGHDSMSSRAEYSHFPDEAGVLACELFLRGAQLVFDPFAGWGERAKVCHHYQLNYVGFDVNPEAIEFGRREFGVENTLADSRTAEIPCFDALFTCPPYWNLETYSPHGIENARTFDEFTDAYGLILERCYEAAKCGARFCFVVGDWRADHVYHDLAYQTQRLMDALGATAVDEVILSRRNISKIKVMIPQAVRLGYTVKVHEKMLAFVKA
jgi:DNA modification methylase